MPMNRLASEIKTVYYLPEENPEYIGVGHDTIQYSRMRSSGD